MTGRVAPSRDEEIIDLCRGRRVLHVGCTDAPFTMEKIRSGELLHSKLIPIAAELIGCDIDTNGLDQLDRALPGAYLEFDVSVGVEHPSIESFRPDLILASDVIEHVEDQTAFVRGLALIARRYHGAQVVLSTPNALALRQTVHTVLNREVIHPDHRLLHSPRTMQYLLSTCGLTLSQLIFYNLRTGDTVFRRTYDAAPRVATKLRPAFADGLLAVAIPG